MIWPDLRRGVTGQPIWENPDVRVLVERTEILRREIEDLGALVLELSKNFSSLLKIATDRSVAEIEKLSEEGQ